MEDLKKIKSRIDWFCGNKVNAFSPTISPAPKSEERNEIESIYEGMNYFFTRGVEEIVLQRKYMGSYCDIYLHKELNETYFVSRNGHRISHIDLEKAREACRELHSRFDWTGPRLIIIQSELMPWSTLGEGLIKNEFEGYLNVHQNHYEHLSHSDLYSKIDKVKKSEKYREYNEDKKQLPAKEFKSKYPHHIIRQYDSLSGFPVLDLNAYRESIDIYKTQIDWFGKKEDLYFKPFNVLKKIYEDGIEEIVNDNLSYGEVNDDSFLHLLVRDEKEFSESLERAYDWFASLQNDREEGILIKPRTAFMKNMPPGFKVRNNNYLSMIYGVDFLSRYDYYLRRRKVGKKLECSINDWMLNWEMLKIKYKDIHTENYKLKNLVFDRIMGERIEATLDIRL